MRPNLLTAKTRGWDGCYGAMLQQQVGEAPDQSALTSGCEYRPARARIPASRVPAWVRERKRNERGLVATKSLDALGSLWVGHEPTRHARPALPESSLLNRSVPHQRSWKKEKIFEAPCKTSHAACSKSPSAEADSPDRYLHNTPAKDRRKR
jgi:hypothetical protein